VRRARSVLFLLGALSLSQAHAESSEIIVAGQKSVRGARDATLASSRIDEEDLARPGESAASVLGRVPGVQTASSGAASELATASVRGATSAQTPVYLAGIRLNDDITGTADLSLVPLWMLARAEVYRGGSPDDADRMGLGGAVYFDPRLPKKTRVGFNAGLGSYGETSAALSGEVAREGTGALVSFRGSGAKNDYPYVNDQGTANTSDDRTISRQNADYTAAEAWAIGRTVVGERGARITTVFNAFDREQGVSGLGAVPALSSRAETARVLAGVSAKVPCSSDARCELELVTQGISARSRLSDPKRALGLQTERIDSSGSRVGESVRFKYDLDWGRVFAGANYEFERLALDGNGNVRATRDTTSGRVGAAYFLNRQLLVSAFVVETCDRTAGPNQSSGCAGDSSEFHFGDAWKASGFTIRFNATVAHRVPTLGELYGISPLVRGSSVLVPEHGRSVDSGARWETQLGPARAYLDGFGFARFVDDLIAYRRSSLGAVTPYNVGSARVLGAELEGGAVWVNHVRSSLALTLLDPRDTTSGRALGNDLIPFQSRTVGTAFVEGFFDVKSSNIRRFGLDARYSYRSSRFADPAGLIVLPATNEVDLGGSLSIVREISFRAAIDDVFDARHFDFIGYPVPGRTYHMTIEAWW